MPNTGTGVAPPMPVTEGDGAVGLRPRQSGSAERLPHLRECSGSPTPAVNVTEYLEALAGLGIGREDLPPLQPLLQHRVWERFEPGVGSG